VLKKLQLRSAVRQLKHARFDGLRVLSRIVVMKVTGMKVMIRLNQPP
jgi:hypothetical protein